MVSNMDEGMNSSDAYLDWDYRVVSSVIWIPLSLIGISGNLMVILVVMTVRGMKTPTNCYLVSLACADFLFCLSTIPSELASLHLPDNVFVFGRVGCSILRFLPFLSINASSLSITAFTVERYIGICHPMKARYICTVKRAQLIIVAIWIFSILYNSTWLFLTDLKPLNYIDWPDAHQCTFSLSRESYKAIFLIDMFMFYWIPLLLYLILYGVMARTLIKAGVFDLQLAADDRVSVQSFGKRNSVRDNTANGNGLIPSRRITFSFDSNFAIGNRPRLSCVAESPTTVKTIQNAVSTNNCKSPTSPTKSIVPVTNADAPKTPATFNRSFRLLPTDTAPMTTMTTNGRRRSTPESPCFNLTQALALTANQPSSPTSSETTRSSRPGTIRRNASTSSNMTSRASPRGSKASCAESLNRCRAQVVKMLIVIVVTFALFCLPYRGLVVYNSFTRNPWLEKWYLLFAKTMVMANSAINPLLYNLMSGRFRDAFIVMFTQCFKMRNDGRWIGQDGYASVVPRSSFRAELRSLSQRPASCRRSDRRYHSRSSTVGLLGQQRKTGASFYTYSPESVKEKGALLVPIIALTADMANNDDGQERKSDGVEV